MKKIIQTTKIIVLGLILSAGFAFAQIWNGPPAPPPANTNTPTLIDIGPVTQLKSGSLRTGPLGVDGSSLLHGNVRIVGVSTTTPSNLYVSGKVSIGVISSIPPFPSLTEKLEVNGEIKVSTLQSPTSIPAQICVNASGVLVLCPVPQGSITYSRNSSDVQIITGGSCMTCNPNVFKVPDGVTSVTFKAWGGGAGGGGPATGNHFVTGQMFPGINIGAGGGGGSGGYYTTTITGLIPLETFAVLVGSGGSGGTTISSSSNEFYKKAPDGVNGGLSNIVRHSTSVIMAQGNGGSGLNTGGIVKPDSHGLGGAGGSFLGVSGSGIPGGSGISLTNNTNTAPNICANGGSGSSGGDMFKILALPNPPMCNGASPNLNGVNGNIPGGGGGGGGVDINQSMTFTTGNGGIGAAGQVTISW